MIKDRMVRVKLKKSFREQRPFCYVGKVTAFTDCWLVVDAKGIMLSRLQANGVQIDAKAVPVLIPRENIDTIRVLPDNFDMNNIQVTTEGQQLRLVVDGPRDAFLGEMGEG